MTAEHEEWLLHNCVFHLHAVFCHHLDLLGRIAALARSSLLLQTEYLGLSVVLSVCWSVTTWALQKWLSQSWCCLWCWLGWPKEPCIRWGLDTHVRGNFEGEVGPAHWHFHCISAAPCWVASSFSTARHVRASPGLVQCGCCLWRTRWWCTLPSHPCAVAVWPYVRLLQWPLVPYCIDIITWWYDDWIAALVISSSPVNNLQSSNRDSTSQVITAFGLTQASVHPALQQLASVHVAYVRQQTSYNTSRCH